MLIRDRSNMEKVMSITYADLVDKAKELEVLVNGRRNELCEKATLLLKEYRESLGLSPSSDGLAFIGEEVNGDVRRINILQIDTSEDYRLSFKIVTNLSSDSHSKLYYYTNITMWRDSGLKVSVEGRQVNIPGGISEGQFLDVCTAIKQSIVDGLEGMAPKG
ncbi:hypothetical protein [Raoultella ornithinolytica]|uniref:hypothetical protein n=1 Tax=Raoultella ornithinolytica TaxID=54291 RepID=UPI001F18F385|nr:hypothetical protein [Raoultella ornithinolytica]MCE9803723.1 hypothetical protein [Raoultella ornithinolytica]MCE9812528.1 hypothetical protein [Raoultella ornithinolytica]MCE9869033.1 hypothetical protein [Raoultella ornithinolytica]